MRFDTLGLGEAVALSSALRRLGGDAADLADVAGRVTRQLRESLVADDGEPACVLVRLFVTRPLAVLDPNTAQLAREQLHRTGGTADPSQRCLLLVGTTGTEHRWCDVGQSLEHRVIPLPSPDAAHQAPMVAGLLQHIGAGRAPAIAAHAPTPGDDRRRPFDVFAVHEAVGSPLVPAQDEFVLPYGVRSVLGFGATLPGDELFAVVMFSRAPIAEDAAALFEPITQSVKLALLPFTARTHLPRDADADVNAELRERVATLEQLVAVQERTTVAQSEHLHVLLTDAQHTATQLRAARARERSEALVNRVLLASAETIAEHQTIAGILQAVRDAAAELCRADRAVFVYRPADRREPLQLLGDNVTQDVQMGEPPATDRQWLNRVFRARTARRRDATTEVDTETPLLALPFGNVRIGGLLAMPVVSRTSELLGGLFLARDGRRRFSDEQERLLVGLARQAALAIDSALLYEAQRDIALDLQRSLLPDQLPALDGLSLCARYVAGSAAAAVGGDWYDTFPLPDGATAFVVGDVTGHDMRAAAAMGQMRSILRTCAWNGHGPASVLDEFDELVRGLQLPDLATVIYARLEPAGEDGRALLRYANAGHLPPVLITPGATQASLLTSGASVLIGVANDEPRAEGAVYLAPGARLVLYTDGLVERPREDIDVGLHRLQAACLDGPADSEALCDHLLASVHDASSRDDTAILVVQITDVAPGGSQSDQRRDSLSPPGLRRQAAQPVSRRAASVVS